MTEKTVRSSYDKKIKQGAIHMVNAFAAENGVVLGQVKTYEKSNKITSISIFLDLLDIKEVTITTDSMGYQYKIGEKIIKNKSNYA